MDEQGKCKCEVILTLENPLSLIRETVKEFIEKNPEKGIEIFQESKGEIQIKFSMDVELTGAYIPQAIKWLKASGFPALALHNTRHNSGCWDITIII